MADIKGECIALAALIQCCAQIQRLAGTGYVDEHAVSCVIRGVLVTNPQTIEDIYDPSQLLSGFRLFADTFGKTQGVKNPQNLELAKLVLKLMSLGATVERNHAVFSRMGEDIDKLSSKILLEHPDFLSSGVEEILSKDVMHDLASLYQSLISPNFPKLIIYGEESVLSVTENQNKIRALLLAAIRAVVLWHQVGGSRLNLVFRRKALVNYASSFAAKSFN